MRNDLLATLRDPRRLSALRRLALLDTPSEKAFDRLTRLAAKLLHAPVALVSVVDDRRQFFKSSVGLPEPWASLRETPLSHSFCQHVVAMKEPLIIQDAREHALVCENMAIRDLGVVAYLGIPLITSDGHALGSFCVIDSMPRVWDTDQIDTLRDLAASVIAEVEARGEVICRRVADEALRESQRFHRSTLDALSANIAILDDAGIIIAVNAAWRNFAQANGLVGAAFGVGANYVAICEAASGDWAREGPLAATGIRDVIASRRGEFSLEYPCHSPAQKRWFMMRVTKFEGEGKVRVVVAHENITERKLAEEASQRKEDRYRSLVLASAQIVWTTTADGLVVEDSPSWRTFTGQSTQEFGGRGWLDALHPGDRLLAAHAWAQAIATKSLYETEYRLRTADGVYRDTVVRGVPVLEQDGGIREWVGMNIDVTERKQAEADLRNAKEAAETADRAKTEFFSRMSHELRTPLNAILGFGQLLAMDQLSADQRESVEQIMKGGRHLLNLINELLDIARIEAGKSNVLSLEDMDVSDVVGEILGMIQPLADQAHVRLVAPQPGTCHRFVRADRQRLKQVLFNLLSNAIKYNRHGGMVSVCCGQRAGAVVRITVTDTGCGIPPEHMKRLFSPFERLEAERKGVEGTGLGLALSKGLIEAMHGTIGVESRVGQGSTFWVELSEADSAGGPAGAVSPVLSVGEGTYGRAGTVLVVEDNPASLQLMERLLKHRQGVRLLSASEGRLGLDVARQHHPDVIFLDLHLPDVKGDEVLRQLREDAKTCDIPVVMLSADATPHQIERLLDAGASRYLPKPFAVDELFRIFDELLNTGSQ